MCVSLLFASHTCAGFVFDLQVSAEADLSDAQLEASIPFIFSTVCRSCVGSASRTFFQPCVLFHRFPKGLHVETIETEKVRIRRVRPLVLLRSCGKFESLMRELCARRRSVTSRSAESTTTSAKEGNSRNWRKSRLVSGEFKPFHRKETI